MLGSEAEWVLAGNIELSAPSSKWSLSLWGRNLTDEQVSQTATDNGIGNGYTLTQQPRTFGATFNYAF
jgi:outer membrane receptor protein involved in Fe transport